MKTVVVDIYGADIGPEPIVAGALKALDAFKDLKLCFIGQQELIDRQVKLTGADASRVCVRSTKDHIRNEESAMEAFRGREEASLVMALRELKEDPDAIGMISPGNTGALLVGSIFRLGLIPQLKKPALCSVIPCQDGKMLGILDCGANLECTAADLTHYALMGSALMRCLGYAARARVGLLCVGAEDQKGSALTLEAFSKLKALPINFVGNIEGYDVTKDVVDIVVTDGFSGNILLKTIEGVGKSAICAVDSALAQAGAESREALQKLKARLENAYDFNPRGGAVFLGTAKPVIKMHGSATQYTPFSCIEQLMHLEQANYRAAIREAMENA